MTRSNVAFHQIDDESMGRQYEVRIVYEVVPWEPGDFTTPPAGGTPMLSHLEVLQVRHFDADGVISGVDIGQAARRYDQRAWKLVDEGILTN